MRATPASRESNDGPTTARFNWRNLRREPITGFRNSLRGGASLPGVRATGICLGGQPRPDALRCTHREGVPIAGPGARGGWASPSVQARRCRRSSGPFPALSLCGRAVLERWVEPGDCGSIGVPKRQAGGLRSGVRVVVTSDNTDNRTPTRHPVAPRVRAVRGATGATRLIIALVAYRASSVSGTNHPPRPRYA